MNYLRTQRSVPALMLAALFALFLTPAMGWAQEEATSTPVEVTAGEPAGSEVEHGMDFAINTVLLFLCAVLVFLMQAGFSMVEAGLNSAKNAVNILFKNSMDICVGVLLFFAVGFGLMYPGAYGIDVEEHPYLAFGGFGLENYELGADAGYAPSADWFFQAMFAATAATIVSGAVAGRMRVGAYLIYSAIITGLIYPISGFWKWGGGWLTQFEGGLAFQDFAGSAVVHAVGGFSGLAGAIVLGPRLGRFVDGKSMPMPGHSMPLAALGVFILWFGWYGFNPGSQLAFTTAADATAVTNIALNTTLAAGAGGIVATLLSWLMFGKPDLSMGLNGILGGLVGITACCDCMDPWMSMLVGAVGGVLVIAGALLLNHLKIDDPVGAWPVHGLCGIWGCLAIGLLPNSHFPESGEAATSLGVQLIGTLTYCAWAFVTMLVLFGTMRAIGILRVTPEDELAGLDLSEHGMKAYQH